MKKIRRKKKRIAVTVSIVTTLIKIALLYVIETGWDRQFPGYFDIVLIVAPYIAVGVAAMRTRRWYLVLIVDSMSLAASAVVAFALWVMAQATSF
ncbi:MAG: hypothetical protein ABIO36_01580 [Pyrinomonadaceae bacterium]